MGVLKMKNLLEKLTPADKQLPSPSGSIDKKGAKQAAGAGLAMAPVGAYTGEFVDLIYEGINSWAPSFVQKLMGLSFAEDMVGAVTGFTVGALVTAVWKYMRQYN